MPPSLTHFRRKEKWQNEREREREREVGSHSSVEPFTESFAFQTGDSTGRSPPVQTPCCFTPVEASCSFSLKCARLNRLTSYPTTERERVEGEVCTFHPPHPRASLSLHQSSYEWTLRSPHTKPEVRVDCSAAVKRARSRRLASKHSPDGAGWCVFNKPL